MREKEMKEIARFIRRAAIGREEPAHLRTEVAYLLDQFPLGALAFSFDGYVESTAGRRLLEEMLGW
jgi:glycine hydroxymethyltransferase